MKTTKADKRSTTDKTESVTQRISLLPDKSSVAPAGQVTEAVALERTKKLIERCEPKTAETARAHRLLAFFLLSVETGHTVFSQHLTDCFTTKEGEDIGEPPDSYDGWDWLYPQTMIANLEDEIGQNNIADRVKDDFDEMLSQANQNATLAKAYLDLNTQCDSTGGSETLAFIRCLAFEFVKAKHLNPDLLIDMRKKADEQPTIKTQPEKGMMTILGAAKYAGVDERTIRRWLKSTQANGAPMLPEVVKVGRKRLIPRISLDLWRKEDKSDGVPKPGQQ